MRKVCFILTLIGLVLSTLCVFAQSTSKTVPNDLADGDLLISPKTVRKSISVGGASSDVPEFTSAAIQMAVDSAALRGGGMVKLKPGTYAISSPVRLASNVTLVGDGDSTILHKIDGFRSFLDVDADYGMLKVTVRDARGFRPGMGVQLSDTQYPSDYDVTVATIIDIEGNTLFLDQPSLRDYDCAHKAVLSNACSVVEAVGVEHVRIADFVVEGNDETNDVLGGCRGGAIYIHRSSNCLVEHVKARNFNGDVFSWQITKDVTVRNCEASFSSGKGFHPGTGAENTVIEACSSHHNRDGIFLCWRVKKSTVKNNILFNNKRDGLSLNKKDTDNSFVGNHIYKNGRNGVWFNDYGEANNSHRNVFENNIVEDNGSQSPGYGFFIGSHIRDISIHNNTIRDNGTRTQKAGVLISKSAQNIDVLENVMAGHADGDVVRK